MAVAAAAFAAPVGAAPLALPVPSASPAAASPPAQGESAGGAQAAASEAGATVQAVRALVFLGSSQGTHQLTVRLDPPELGRLQIRLTQTHDGPPQVTVTAERQQTLDLLHRDQASLHRALDQAGVTRDGRELSFQLAVPHANLRAAGAAPTDTTSTWSQQASASANFAGSGGGAPRDGGGQGQPTSSWHAGASTVAADGTLSAADPARRRSSALDITA
jgi:hypothetical protein